MELSLVEGVATEMKTANVHLVTEHQDTFYLWRLHGWDDP